MKLNLEGDAAPLLPGLLLTGSIPQRDRNGSASPALIDLSLSPLILPPPCVPSLLPVHAFRSEIIETVKHSPITIISAETGAGKTTQIPKFFLEEGFSSVVTQPRRTAVRTVSGWVASQLGETIGQTVGYRTSEEHLDSPSTRLLFCTDGLQLVRELFNTPGKRDILFIDEIHEWNLNNETLLAYFRREVQRNPSLRLVIMSATLQAEALSEYCGGAPVIQIPGRMFPVEEREAGRSIVEDAASLLREGRNVLVFEPGKKEISMTVRDVMRVCPQAVVLPLHAQLTAEEQALCFQHYDRPKCIVATNVAQTSITIDDIDAVVDSGLERRLEVVNGIEGLYTLPVSIADRNQRKGRAGRTKPGIFIDHCPLELERRASWAKPEIKRISLEHCCLRLAKAGFNMEDLEFYHQPPRKLVAQARNTLTNLKCMDRNGCVTEIGHQAALMPISVQGAVMINQAMRLEHLHPGLTSDVALLASILEADGITEHDSKSWRRFCPLERDSDLIAQALVYRQALHISPPEHEFFGINTKSFERAKAIYENVLSRLVNVEHSDPALLGRRDYRKAVIQCIFAGQVENIYERKQGVNLKGKTNRVLSKDSVVEDGRLLVGNPFDIEIPDSDEVMRLLLLATKVDLDLVKQQAPWALQHLSPKLRDKHPKAQRLSPEELESRKKHRPRYKLVKTKHGKFMRRDQQGNNPFNNR